MPNTFLTADEMAAARDQFDERLRQLAQRQVDREMAPLVVRRPAWSIDPAREFWGIDPFAPAPRINSVFIDEAAALPPGAIDRLAARSQRHEYQHVTTGSEPYTDTTRGSRHSFTGPNRQVREYRNRVEYRLYDTPVVTCWRNSNHITLRHGGFHSVLTCQAINQVAFSMRWRLHIHLVARVLWIDRSGDVRAQLVDGTTIAEGAVLR